MLYLSRQERIVLTALLAFGLIGVGVKFFSKTRPDLVFSQKHPTLGKDAGKIIRQSQTVNINKADIQTFEQIPGIGPSLAKQIVEYRRENGCFSQIEDLMNIKGIGKKKFDTMKQYLSVE